MHLAPRTASSSIPIYIQGLHGSINVTYGPSDVLNNCSISGSRYNMHMRSSGAIVALHKGATYVGTLSIPFFPLVSAKLIITDIMIRIK